MAGLYIHIPFCTQKCYYCDFFKSVNLRNKGAFLQQVLQEIVHRKTEFSDESISTIYFGGGTPSVFSVAELQSILDAIFLNYKVENEAEITMEANPDDLSVSYLQALKQSAFNRLSIGIQSFDDAYLKLMNRRHTANEGLAAVRNAQDLGFGNLSLDLIYGLPKLDLESWQRQLDTLFDLKVQHLSAYHLTYEPNTVFYKYLKDGKFDELDDTFSAKQYELLVKSAVANDFTAYEISNFGKENFFSKHNTSYWKQVPYLGFGPSAHSFKGNLRRWNRASLKTYLATSFESEDYFEFENLSENNRYNELIMTGLRTMWGVDTEYLKNTFSGKLFRYFQKVVSDLLAANEVYMSGKFLIVSDGAKFLTDRIIGDLFFV